MNEDLIYKMIKPYIKNNTLTYAVFLRLFDVLRTSEQYQIINLIEEKFQIRLIDNLASIDLPDFDVEEFNSLYDKGAFANDAISTCRDMDYRQANDVLCALIRDGNESAKEAICVKNQRLVYKYAYAYHKYYGNSLDIEDLAQAGYIGLLRGAEKFDSSKGTSFSTYAVYWIKQSITRELVDKGFTIRLPVHVFEKINKIAKLDSKYDELGYSFDERVDLISKDLEMPIDRVLELFVCKFRYLQLSSLDVPVGEEEETPLISLINDNSVENPETLAHNNELHDVLEKALSSLSEREEKVIRLRYGFDGDDSMTLEAIGQIMGVTRERVRQIENKALRKLSHYLSREKFDDFFNE